MIAPDLLNDLRELPLAGKTVITAVGFVLWAAGWWAHRFWVVLAATLGAGVLGLRYAPDFGVQPMVAGLLAAVAAGGLALSLARVALFAGCGVGCWLAVQTLMPHWSDPLICILTGGLLGVLLFRFWIIVVTSTLGAILMGYGGLVLAEPLFKFDAVAWATNKDNVISISIGVAILVGVVHQYIIERMRKRYRLWKTGRFDEDYRERKSKGWFFSGRKAA